jgi:DNA-binding transcriptional regulator LsrR (DeoR family)
MKPEQRPVRQLRVELATRSDIERFLNAAVQLAKIMDVELEAVFLRDQGMLDAAALPMVQEVCLWTAKEQHTSTTILSRSMRIQAQQIRTLLAKIAKREAVSYSFVSEQSQLVEPEVIMAESCIRWVGGRGLSSRPDIFPVCVIDSGDEAGQACLRQAAELSARTNRPLKVYKLDGGSESEHQAEINDLDDWLQHARNMACFVLFMPKSTYTKYRGASVLEQIPFPVLLV